MSTQTTIHRGLENVAVASTKISLVDGARGRLIYRGHDARKLAAEKSFEEVLHLLWYGTLPSEDERAAFTRDLTARRSLPGHVREIIAALPPGMDMMSVLRTAVSALGTDSGADWPPTVDQAKDVTAKIPTIIALRHRLVQGLKPVDPDPNLSHAANYLHMLRGQAPNAAHARALDAYLVLTAEHGFNASTFSARVTTSTESDLISSLTSAIGTMKGPLHGGAPSKVAEMLEEIGTKERAEVYLRGILERGERIMGFGHRVYKVRDPRAEALALVARQLAGEDPWLDLAVHVEDVAIRLLAEYKPGRNLFTNVEFYAAAVLRTVQLPEELYTPTFSLARAGGWTAHVLEQAADNRLIRPTAVYEGEIPPDESVTP